MGIAIVVPDIMGGELVIPLAFSGIGIERQYAVREQVITEAGIAIPVRRGIAGGPVKQVELGVVRANSPGWGATGLVRGSRPGFITGLASGRHRVVTPDPLAGVYIVGIEESPHAVFATGNTDNGHILDDKRGRGSAKATVVLDDFAVPENRT